MRRTRRRCALGAVVVLLAAGASCSDGTVVVQVRPAVGDTAEYRISVQATTVTTLAGEEPRRRTSSVVLRARQRVLESGADGARVEVRLIQGGESSTFVVRLDPGGQLAEVQQVEGLPAAALGGLGLSELLPSAATAPPARPLEPGERWDIAGPVRLGEQAATTLTGTGRLASLGVVDGRRLAFVDSTYAVAVERAGDDGERPVLLDGRLRTRSRSAYDLDGSRLDWVRATSSGDYTVTFTPPPGVGGIPVTGTLRVAVTSFSDRVG